MTQDERVVTWSRSDVDTAVAFSRLNFGLLNVGFNTFFKEPGATGIVCVAPSLLIYGGKLPVKVGYDDNYMTVRVSVNERVVAGIESTTFASFAVKGDSQGLIQFVEDLVSSELFK